MEHAVLRLYLAKTDPLAQWEREAIPLLSPVRQERLRHLRPQSDRLHAMGAGLLLRRVLGREEELVYGPQGKPSLPGGPCFNLSHGGGLAVLAVFAHEVGVDIEPPPERVPPRSGRFFRPEELAFLDEDPSPGRFAWLWTRLESVLKADGRGFALEGRTFSLLEGEPGPWHLETREVEGHVLSCAAKCPFVTQMEILSTQELLSESV